MTGRNPNVFYEVGYAHALGKIVILLTQDTNDIPFDLKHHQHIVYKGKIDELRKALLPKLRWAIGEAQRQRTQSVVEKLEVSIGDTLLPEASDSKQSTPLISGSVEEEEKKETTFQISFAVRNVSEETTPAITHIYLFTPANCRVAPAERQRFKTSLGLGGGFISRQSSFYSEKLVVLKNIELRDEEADHELKLQYRIKETLPALPPGAVESLGVLFKLSGGALSESLFRLRIHSSFNFYDYDFKLKIKISKKSKKTSDKASKQKGTLNKDTGPK